MNTFDTKCHETVIAMQKQPCEELLDNVYFTQLEQSDQLKLLVTMYILDMVQKPEPKSYTKLKRMVTRYPEQNIRALHFSTRDRLGDKPSLVVSQSLRKGNGKQKGSCNQWVSKGQCSTSTRHGSFSVETLIQRYG